MNALPVCNIYKICFNIQIVRLLAGEHGSPLQIIHCFYCIKSYVYKHKNSSVQADDICPTERQPHIKKQTTAHFSVSGCFV